MEIDIGQLKFIDKNLRVMVVELEKELGIVGIVTSLLRLTGKGVHTVLPLRGVDWRCRYKPLGNLIVEFINARWQYDPERPEMVCCMCHDVGKGLHLHFQTHPNTVRR